MFILLPNAFGDAATNMAIDTALLHTLPKGVAVFRHYGWTEPSLTFGYAQPYAEVRTIAPKDIRLCRRPTGGGIVDHRNDWTYALVIHTELPTARTPAGQLYKKIHHSLARALEEQRVQSQLAPCPSGHGSHEVLASYGKPQPNQCFYRPALNDVINPDGIKIAGAAMKRTRAGLLVQGSIDRATLPLGFDFPRFTENFYRQLAKTLCIPAGIAEDLRALFNGPRIAEERARYAGDAWNRKR